MSKKDRKPFTDVSMPRQVTYSVAEHEILLSFNGDDDAVAFADWWNSEGTFLFRAWHDKREES